jgi:hypothetical protein
VRVCMSVFDWTVFRRKKSSDSVINRYSVGHQLAD